MRRIITGIVTPTYVKIEYCPHPLGIVRTEVRVSDFDYHEHVTPVDEGQFLLDSAFRIFNERGHNATPSV